MARVWGIQHRAGLEEHWDSLSDPQMADLSLSERVAARRRGISGERGALPKRPGVPLLGSYRAA